MLRQAPGGTSGPPSFPRGRLGSPTFPRVTGRKKSREILGNFESEHRARALRVKADSNREGISPMAREAMAATGVARSVRNHDDLAVWSDQRLLSQFLARSDESAEAAFATLIERHGPLVHRVCLDILRGPDEAQDAAQAVFLVLARKARSIRKPESLGPWLHGVAIRVARHARSEMARRRVAERSKAEMLRRRPATESGLEPMDHTELHEEIDRLPEKYRRPIILCYMQGKTHAQAAEMLGWPVGTVQIRLHRGREQLRSRLTRRGRRPDRSDHDRP